MQLTRPRTRSNPKQLKLPLLWNQIVLNRTEIGLIATLAAISGYMLWVNPAALMAAVITGLLAITFALLNQSVESVAGFGLPIKGWHLGSVVIAVAAIAAVGHIDPVSAQMFNNLEQAVNDAVSNTAGTTVDPAVIATIFNIFRILIVLAFLIGVVIVFTQATRGGDWQPIANLLAIGIAFVIGVEVISQLIIGGGGGGGGTP
jgi:hypothetical protein